MKAYKVIGFKTIEAKKAVLHDLIDHVKTIEAWRIGVTLALIFDCVENELNENGLINGIANYELSQTETYSGHTENISIDLDDIEYQVEDLDD